MSDIAIVAPAVVTESEVNPAAVSAAPVSSETPPDPVQESPKVPKESARFAQLAKKEKQLQADRTELKHVEAELNEKYAQYERFENAKRQAKLNPLAALEALGITYDQLTDFVINDNRPTPDAHVQALKDELDGFKRQQEDERKQAKEAAEKQQLADAERNEQMYFARCDGFVKKNADTYELINANEAFELVHEVVRARFDATGQVLSEKEAADLVETYLEEAVMKNTATKKFQAKVSATLKAPPQSKQSSKTLNNSLSPTTASLASATKSESDRMARALAALGQK